MREGKSEGEGATNLGPPQIFQIQAFILGQGFVKMLESAESSQKALERFKGANPTAKAVRIASWPQNGVQAPSRVRYVVWWRRIEGSERRPDVVFLFDEKDELVGVVPEPVNLDFARTSQWEYARRRSSESNKHELEQVDELEASLIATEIAVQDAEFWTRVDREYRDREFEDPFQIEGRPKRPELRDLKAVVQAINEGWTFGLPFLAGKPLLAPNAYWVAGTQRTAGMLTVGPDWTRAPQILPNGWMRFKLSLRSFVAPDSAWLSPPNDADMAEVFVEVDPNTVDFDFLNRGFRGNLPA